ncbi:MAG: Tn7 transposase TnsA N-terminal domain-containing protein [Candidatus Hodarchaeales archaeon]
MISWKRLREPDASKISFHSSRPTKKGLLKPFSRKLGRYVLIEFETVNMMKEQKGESILEMHNHIVLEQAPSVKFFEYQSVPENIFGECVEIPYIGLNKKPAKWTPDSMIIWENNDIWIIEVKTLEYLKKHHKKMLNKFTQTEEYCADNGWKFYVFTNEHVKEGSYRVANLLDLESQLNHSTKACKKSILEFFYLNTRKKWNTIQLQTVMENEGFTKGEVLASVFDLIYINQLFIDLDKAFTLKTPITTSSDNHLPLVEWFMQFDWRKTIKQLNDDEDELECVVDESKLSDYERKVYRRSKAIVIDKFTKNKLKKKSGIVTNKILAEKYKISEKQVRRILIKFRKENDPNFWKKCKEGKLKYNCLVPNNYLAGRKKICLFKVGEDGKPDFSLDKHFEKAIEFYSSREQPTKKQAWGYYKASWRKFAYEKDITDSDYVPERILRKALKLYRIKLVRKDTFEREFNRYVLDEYRWEVDVARLGRRTAAKIHNEVLGTTPFCNYLGQMVQIDNTLADAIGVTDKNFHILTHTIYEELKDLTEDTKIIPKYLPRPNITTAEDIASRVILAATFRYRSPSAETVLMTLRSVILGKISPLIKDKEKRREFSTAEKIIRGFETMREDGLISDETLAKVREYYRGEAKETVDGEKYSLKSIADWWDNLRIIPSMIHVDRGRDLVSKAVGDWTLNSKVSKATRPVGGSNYGGHVERVLRTLNENAFHPIPGTTKGSIDKRGDYASGKCAVFTFQQLEAVFLHTIVIYHVSPHRGLKGKSPYQKWQACIEAGHNVHDISKKSDSELKHLALNTLKEEKLKYTINQGVTIHGQTYNYEKRIREDRHESLDKSWVTLYGKMSNPEIDVRCDSSDVRFIYWWNPNTGNLDKTGKPKGMAVKVWTDEIVLGDDKKLNRAQLKKSPPIPLLLIKDKEAQARLPLVERDAIEMVLNQGANINFHLQRDLHKSKKTKAKAKTAVSSSDGKVVMAQVAIVEQTETDSFLGIDMEKDKEGSEEEERVVLYPIVDDNSEEDGGGDEEEIIPYDTEDEWLKRRIFDDDDDE